MQKLKELWPGGPVFGASVKAFPVLMDSVLLAAFADMRGAGRVMDIGCGSGLLIVLLAHSCPDASFDGIELNPEAAEAARLNILANSITDRAVITTGDACAYETLGKQGGYDVIVSNPPYFERGSGRLALDADRADARGSGSLPLEVLCGAAAYHLRHGGRFSLVHRAERLSCVLREMTNAGIEPKRLRFVHHDASRKASLVLVEGRRGGKPGLTVMPPLVLHGENGAPTREYLDIYHIQD